MDATDQTLLRQYLNGGDDAFGVLLDRHAGLVYGVAVRATGDPGTAEEVVQDVFLLLSKKARQLAAHPSVAGWLHRTSQNLARHARRRRLCRDRHLFSFKKESQTLHASEATGEGDSRPGEKLDALVRRLPGGDREAVLLRFYEDREYREIAQRLEISEEAARKRVSRALKRLQNAMGPEMAGVGGGATLASLAIAPPPGFAASVAAGIPAAAAHTSTTTGVLAIMTKQTVIKAAAAVAIGGSLLYHEVDQRQEKKRLVAELNRLEETLAMSVEQAEREQAAIVSAADNESDAKWTARVALLEGQLDDERRKSVAVGERIKELESVAGNLKDEVVISYGKVEEIGSNFGGLFAEALALSEIEKRGELDQPENMRRYIKFIESAASLSGLSREIIGFDGNPEEGSRFFASTYAAVFDLDETTTEEVRASLEGHLQEAVNRGITLQDLPREKLMENPEHPPEEVKNWFKTRQAYYAEVRSDLRDLVPLEKRSQFDQWVEKGGIGFQNIKLKEHQLAFSLGGDQ